MLVGSGREEDTRTDKLLRAVGEVMNSSNMLDVVALLEDSASDGLVRGQVGTIVEVVEPGVFEVDFSDDNGQTYAIAAFRADQLLLLHHHSMNGAPSLTSHS
jgi:hypothetical protein